MIQEKIKNLIEEALENLGIEADDITLEHPADLKMGDYSTNVALKFFGPETKVVNNQKHGIFTTHKPLSITSEFKNPIIFAEKIVENLNKNLPREIERVEAKNGFVNFYLNFGYFNERLKRILELGDEYGKSDIHKGKKILVEHSSPNLFKPFHIGHVMNNAVGESITRLARFSGAEVKEISYPSDVSYGIGKAVWAMIEDGLDKFNLLPNEESKVSYLGHCYVRGTKALEEDPSLESRMREITKFIYDKTESKEYEAYKVGREINLEYFKRMVSKFGSVFDDFIFESEAGKEGERLVRENTGTIFEESDGAVVYKGEQDGLHTRVFINKEGYPTYEAKDVGLLSLKFSQYKPDLSIFVTDHEQSDYFKVVVTAAGKINKIWQEKTVHRTHGRMSFKGQKMSSRLGGVPLASDLLSVLVAEIADRTKDRETVDVKEDPEAIAVGALKFAILRAMAGKNINFDPETSLSFEGDSGPYLQYSNVRANSVLNKVGANFGQFSEYKEIGELEKLLDKFEEVVQQCIELWEPHHIVSYLLQLSQAFNSWYGRVKIIDEENKNMNYNLALVKAFHITTKNGLYLLGIKAPERM